MMDYRRRCEILEREITALRDTVVSLAITLVETQTINRELVDQLEELRHAGNKRLQAIHPDDKNS